MVLHRCGIRPPEERHLSDMVEVAIMKMAGQKIAHSSFGGTVAVDELYDGRPVLVIVLTSFKMLFWD